MYNTSFNNLYEDKGVTPKNTRYKYIVKTYACDIIEIDRKDIVYWSEKIFLQRKGVLELLKILEFIHTCLEGSSFYLDEAKKYEFGNDLFCRANVIFYKDASLAISDGKSGRLVIDTTWELESVIGLLSKALDNK